MRVSLAGCLITASLFSLLTTTGVASRADTIPIHKANYDLAAKWTGQKVGKLVFDMAVAPHWLEFSDRFWYSYETSAGRKFYLVDPKARTKKPLFDNARMAAMLTRISLFPYDAQHLPIRTLKFINKDTAIQFEIDYPKDASVRDGEQVKTVQELGDNSKTDAKIKNDDMTDRSKGKGTDTGKETDSKTKTLYFDYDL